MSSQPRHKPNLSQHTQERHRRHSTTPPLVVVTFHASLLLLYTTLLYSDSTALAQTPYKSTETVQNTGIAPNPLSPDLSIFSSINLCDSALTAAAVWVKAPYLRADVAPLFRQLQPLVNDGQPTIYRE